MIWPHAQTIKAHEHGGPSGSGPVEGRALFDGYHRVQPTGRAAGSVLFYRQCACLNDA